MRARGRSRGAVVASRAAARERRPSTDTVREGRRPALIVSCEHGGNRVPGRYAALFDGAGALLASHRGMDHGSADVAARLARLGGEGALIARTTRLLVDLNRSPHHRGLFSELTRGLDVREKARILREHYQPYRQRLEAAIERAVAGGRVAVHVSSHSFVPLLEGVERRADLGLLYDPSRANERAFAAAWRAALLAGRPDLRVRRNYPYRGVADGQVTYLRKRFDAEAYVGLELEVNQRLVGERDWPQLIELLAGTLDAVLRSWAGDDLEHRDGGRSR